MNLARESTLPLAWPVPIPVQKYRMKHVLDFVASLIALILLSPLFLTLAILIKLSSPGPVFYSQKRIGRGGKPFTIYKFRSMYQDAEKNGPQLSHPADDRCTPIGKIMRRLGIDELPQLWNVLTGDMSIIGPRPEREYYVRQIIKRNPLFCHLLKVRPGITSLGQVYYGYASNIDQMTKRLRFDLLYIENLSMWLDFKIGCATIMTVLQGRNI